MLKKLVSIRNVGRFRNSAAADNPELSRHTLIVGANGFGKTTLCAVLRSLKSGDPSHITGRKTLGVEDPPTVELVLSGGAVRFDGEAWSAAYPAIAIFDDVFVTENVHSDEVVEIDHRRNLFRVIIGEEGVHLAEEDARLAELSRLKTVEISAALEAILPHIPMGMNLNQFLALPPEPDVDALIAEQERIVAAVRQAKQIKERPPLSMLALPSVPEDFAGLLAGPGDTIAQALETHLAEHLATHGMEADGGNWIVKGLDHADGGTCPFCGGNIQGLPLIAAYRDMFSARYRALRDEVAAMRTQLAEQFGEGALGRLNVRVEQNKSAVEFWGRYLTFDPTTLAFPDDIPDAMLEVGRAALALLDIKDRTPFEPIQPGKALINAAAAYGAAQARAQEIAEATLAVNAMIAAKKEETGAADVQAAEAELARRKAIKVRHVDALAGLCTDYARLTSEKEDIDDQKSTVRAQLDEHARNVMEPYEGLINHYLDAFNASFRITETTHGYAGGTAASSFQLVIDNTAIDLGDSGTAPDQPSFKNTLSSGDRTTLALAFFLASLARDQALADKIVVFDDPCNSQDAFRRRQSVHEITKVARECAQVIVLSHDATFLKQVWDKAPPADRVALTLADHRAQGSKIMSVDLEGACQGRMATDLDDLQTHVTTGEGNLLDLIHRMRGVLETHCWTTYPASFEPGLDWLSEIVGKIRDGGDQHPAKDLYEELDQLNDYTSQYHHGEDSTYGTPDQIDPSELTGYVRRTLKIVNALQA